MSSSSWSTKRTCRHRCGGVRCRTCAPPLRGLCLSSTPCIRPPLQGLDLVLDPHDAPDAAAPEGSVEATRQAQLKRLVDTASQAFIPVSQEVRDIDATYLAERASAYSSTLRPAVGPSAGTSLPLKPSAAPPAEPPAGLDTMLAALLIKPPTAPVDAALARSTARAAAAAMTDIAIRGKHKVLVPVG